MTVLEKPASDDGPAGHPPPRPHRAMAGFDSPDRGPYHATHREHRGWHIVETQRDADPLQQLLQAAGAGDRQAFARVYDLASPRLFAIALRVARRRDMAEDILQEAFLTIWEKADRYDPERGSPLAWMSTIVRYRAIDRLRRREASDPGGVADETENLAETEDVDGTLETYQVAGDIRNGLALLAEKPREAILLAYYYGMTHEELALRLDAPLGTVKSWVRRGLLQLREHLAA